MTRAIWMLPALLAVVGCKGGPVDGPSEGLAVLESGETVTWVRAQAMYDLFRKNEVTAEQRWKDRRVHVGGEMKSVKSFARFIVMDLDGDLDLHFSLADGDALGAVQPGALVIAECTCGGAPLGVWLHECRLAKLR